MRGGRVEGRCRDGRRGEGGSSQESSAWRGICATSGFRGVGGGLSAAPGDGEKID